MMGDSAENSTSRELSWNLPDDPSKGPDAGTGGESPPRSRRGDDVFDVGTVIEDRYKLYKRLGKGAVGTVWEAYDQKLGRPVALKLIRTDCEDEMAERFVHEAKAAAALQTVHVVAVYDNGVYQGVPYIVMERLEGETVADVLDRNGQLRLEQVASLLVQCAAALRCAHERGIIHRDLKPANLFVSTSEDGYETIKLLDFGVAKQPDDDASREATESGVILGTPHYMSPEQARANKDLDHRTDLWSLTVILFRALTGKRPWTGGAAIDVILNICSEPPPAPSEFRPELSAEVDAFFDKAFAENVDERFQNVDALRDAFLEALDLTPTSLRDARSTALTTGKFAAWDSGTNIPRPRLSDGGKEPPSAPSVSAVVSQSEAHEVRAHGTLSLSTSVRDFEHAVRARRRTWFLGAAVAVIGAGVAFAVLAAGGDAESQSAPAEQASPSPASTGAAASTEVVEVSPSATESPSAASATVPSATASAKTVAPRTPWRRPPRSVPRDPKPSPKPSPDGKKRLPLY